MAATKSSPGKLKASERTTLIGKLVTPLKKRYGSKVPEPAEPRDVLQTLLFGAMLEDNTDEAAESGLSSLITAFHDLNEIRVSSIREIERSISDMPAADWRSLRIKDALQHIFELNFNYDLDGLRKKNQDSANSDLSEIPNISPFMRLYTLQAALGNHVVPVDPHQLALLKWLGLSDGDVDGAADELKSAVRKTDGPLVSYLLRQAANEPGVLVETLEFDAEEAGEVDPKKRISELAALIDGGGKSAKKATKQTEKKPVKKKAKASAAKKKAAN